MEKIKKRKTNTTFDKRFENPKAGRPPLEDKEITNEQKEFAILIARGVPEDTAGKHCEFSDYQTKRYLNLQSIKDEIVKWQNIFGKEDIEKFITLYNKVNEEVFLELIKRIRGKSEGALSEVNLMKIFQGKLMSMGLSTQEIIEKTKLIQRSTTKETKPKIPQIENKQHNDRIEFNTEDIESPSEIILETTNEKRMEKETKKK